MLVLALESSTSAAKALLYDTEKGIAARCQKAYPAEICRGGVTDTEGIFKATMEVGREAAQGKSVEAIAVCGIWHSLVVCDRDFRPETKTYAWNYTGAAEMCAKMRQDEKTAAFLYRRTGCMPHSIYTRHTMALLRQRGVELEGRLLVTQGAYNYRKLTGEFRETACTQSGSGLMNLQTCDYDDEIMERFGVRREQFGPLVTYRDTAPLTAEAASYLGLRSGIPVVPSYPDGALNQVGSFAQRPGAMTLSVGTSGALRLTVTRPLLPAGRQLWCYFGVEDWIAGAATNGACNCINWFREQVAGNMPFSELEDGPWDRDCPVFLPFLFGERNPGWHDGRLGGFSGVRPEHTLRDLYNAVRMGALFNLYQCYEIMRAEDGEPKDVIVSGGILNSKSWTQMLADIFRREILVSNQPDASSMGCVALALHAAGYLKDVRDFRADYDNAVPLAPKPERFPHYAELYRRYLDCYGRE